ncbi:MAG: FAD binding domain-containing protein, partial [Thermodesulfobacteriota bacterium]
ARALAQGAGWLGSPQIREVATIGGNVVNAQPAADTSVPLVTLGARARLVSAEGAREAAVEELFLGVGRSAVNPTREVITHFLVPACPAPRQASAMQRMSRRKAFTLPLLSSAVRVEMVEDGRRFNRVRLAVAPVAPVPWLAARAQDHLCGAEATLDNISRAAVLAREDAQPRDSLRGGAEYRRRMVEVLVRRALVEALSQLNQVA